MAQKIKKMQWKKNYPTVGKMSFVAIFYGFCFLLVSFNSINATKYIIAMVFAYLFVWLMQTIGNLK